MCVFVGLFVLQAPLLLFQYSMKLIIFPIILLLNFLSFFVTFLDHQRFQQCFAKGCLLIILCHGAPAAALPAYFCRVWPGNVHGNFVELSN